MITELVYSHILKINRGSIPYKKFQEYVHLSIFKYRLTKNGLYALKSFKGYQETGPWTGHWSIVHLSMYLVGES